MKLWLDSGGIVLCNVSSVQNAVGHPGGFSCSYSWCQMEGEVRLRAGEQKGRWRWGKMKGRTRVTSFTWYWLKPVRTCKREISPRGGKRKRGKRRTASESSEKEKLLLSPLINLFCLGWIFFLFFFSPLLYRIHLHHSFSFLPLPKVGPFPHNVLLHYVPLSPLEFQGDENVPVIVGPWERKRKTPTYQEKLDK